MIKEKGRLVEQLAKFIGSKIIWTEAMYKDASDWLAQTGWVVLAKGGDVTDAVTNHWSFHVWLSYNQAIGIISWLGLWEPRWFWFW
jgi:hypothetical protein